MIKLLHLPTGIGIEVDDEDADYISHIIAYKKYPSTVEHLPLYISSRLYWLNKCLKIPSHLSRTTKLISEYFIEYSHEWELIYDEISWRSI